MADINLGVGGANSAVAGGYEIANSLKLEADNAEYLYYTPSTQTDYQRMAFSIWVKRTELGDGNLAEFGNGTSNTSNLRIGFDSSDRLFCYGNSIIFRQTNQVFRDTSAWYHLFFQFDTTQSTANDRIKIWVNGSMIAHTDFEVINNPGSGAAMGFNNGLQQSIGAQREGGPVNYFKGYIAQVYGSGGTPPVVTDFGEVDENTGIWKPIDISELTPPDTQGFNLDFSDAGNLGNDISSRNNDFTLQNITSADQATDTPTNNFCTWNPLQTGWNTNYGTGQVIVEGATEAYASTNYAAIEGSMAVQSGKWYWESKPNRTGGIMVGVAALNGIRWAGDTAYWSLGMNAQGIGTILGNFYYNGTSTSTDATDWTNGDIVSIALDMDNYKIYMAVNGSWGGTSNPATGTGGYDFSSASNFTSNFVVPAGRIETANSSYVIETNFGGYTTMSIASGNSDSSGYGNFEYAPPSGYYALCTKNLAEFG